MGPAPVTSTRSGENQERAPIFSVWSHALATTLVGSMSMPTSASPGSSRTA